MARGLYFELREESRRLDDAVEKKIKALLLSDEEDDQLVIEDVNGHGSNTERKKGRNSREGEITETFEKSLWSHSTTTNSGNNHLTTSEPIPMSPSMSTSKELIREVSELFQVASTQIQLTTETKFR